MTMKEEKEDAPVKQQHHNVLVYSETPKPILVGAENFQNLVQSLTGGKRKRKSVTFALVNVEEAEAPPAKAQKDPLLDYLDRLDQECPPPSTGAGANRGFFATAGLVKGVRIEEGLQQFETPDSPRNSLGPLALNRVSKDAEKTEKASNTVRCVQVLTPVSVLQGCKLLCSEWAPEWTGCLSPRSGQLAIEAQKTAARWNRTGLGPWTISLDPALNDGYGRDDDEYGYPVDIIYYKGEITMAEQT